MNKFSFFEHFAFIYFFFEDHDLYITLPSKSPCGNESYALRKKLVTKIVTLATHITAY